MRFDYFDMLSGSPIYLQNVGHLRSPTLAELQPTSGIGYRTYNLYLNFLTWNKEQLLKYDRLMQYTKNISKLNKEIFNAFDVATLLTPTRETYRGVLSLFLVEDLIWDEEKHRYLSVSAEDPNEVIGEINRDNFDEVRDLMLQFNFIGLDKSDAPIAHSNDKAKELWERAQIFLKKQSQNEAKANKPEYHLSNIISKTCAIHPSYNLLNIFNLTVFQLYDSFFQLGYLRSVDLNERIFSNHGGEKFNFEDWLSPIIKNT